MELPFRFSIPLWRGHTQLLLRTTGDYSKLRKVLNSHGHSFQHAVLRRLEQLHTDHKSKWVIDGVEFPVFAGQTTHTDFILKETSGRTLLVAECKADTLLQARFRFERSPTRDTGVEH